VGGLRLDSILHKHLKNKFETKYHTQLGVKSNIKLWNKIWEIKKILSSNKEATFMLEGLADNLNFNDKITRTEYEALINPVLEDIMAPIKRFLFDNNLKV
jgi:molecular chaperone DnaK (HSP70)